MIFLIFLSFITFWIIVGNNDREPNWRMAFIQTAILWAGYMILGTEILGWFAAIHRTALTILWSLPIAGGILWLWLWLKRGKVLRLPIVYRRDSWVGTILDIFVILILVITALVAVLAPPNSNNALIYRMSRVAHWAQNESLAHYPTGIESQNSNSPGAEIMQLNFFVLAGNDRTANLVAWIAFAGSIAAAASLAETLGAKFNGQRMAAIFAATIPVAITQASSAVNDIVVTFWIVSTVLMLLHYTRKSQKPFDLILAAIAAALAIATKATALLFLWPFGLYMVVILRKRLGMAKMLLWALVAVAFMSAINGGNFLRNQQAYGQFYRPVELANQTNETRGWHVMVSNIARNAALHADLPFPRAENWLKSNIVRLHDLLDLSVDDPRTTFDGPFFIPEVNTSERTSGNPLHAAIIVVSFIAVVGIVILGKDDPEILIYASAVFFSMLLFSYLLKWQSAGGRLQLPFFVLFAPLVGLFLDKLQKFQLETAVAAVLLFYAIPWLFQTQERPILPNPPQTYAIGIFDNQRELLYFATLPAEMETYRQMTGEIRAADITLVGLDLNVDSKEYLIWMLLGAPDADLRIEWVTTDTPSQDLVDKTFVPEAIICEDCSKGSIKNYERDYERHTFLEFDLFLKPVP